jgi:S-DNA-T family DNA segregation ATPase FtsK/SpoIIIE
VEHIRQVAGALRIPEAHKVWLPPLEKQIGIYGILRTRPGEEPRQRNVPDSLTAVVGVTDDPARQAQYATELDFGQFGSAMVCGGPSSGKTTFLLTASVSLAHLYAPERIRMYLIDGGSGALMSMDTFPHTARTLSAHTQPGDCAKILTQLQNEVKTRQQKLAARGVQDMAAYRRLTGEEIPDTLLVIDDIGEVRKSLEAARSGSAVDSIVYLLKFGASSGIYLLLSACKQQELYKFADSIRPEMRFVLRMPDKTDAREILGLPSNPPVITAPGRGLSVGRTGEKRPLVFQTALPWTVADPAVRLPELRRL